MSRWRKCILLCLLGATLIAGCATGSPIATQPSATAVSQSPEAHEQAAPSEAPVSQTAAPDESPTAFVPSAVPEPTAITVGPAVEPFPLEAGWWDSAVCYEVFVRSFYDSDGDGVGDLNGLIEKLDYINDGDPASQTDLGATCVWLMPITESDTYHGYHVTDFYSVEQDYGTNDDFKRLMEAAHARGISVILDLVLNHTSSEHPWFQEAARNPASPYRDWYIWSEDNPGYNGPWGDVAWHKSSFRDGYYYGVFNGLIPDLNYRNPAVTEEARRISAFWLEEMGVDGFRLDAIKHLIENGRVQENTPETLAWLREYRAFLESIKPDAFTVGEIFGATPVTLMPYYPDQLDSYSVFDVGQQMLTAAATGRARQFTGSVRVTDNSLPFQRYAPFLTNHDQDRTMSVLGDDVAKAKIAATALLTLPGLPFVYYGEEIGMLGQKPDEDIRTPMQWSAESGAGFTSGTPWRAPQQNYREVNVAAQDGDADSLLNLYRQLIHLHTSEPALAEGSFVPLQVNNNAISAYLRQHEDRLVLVVLNFGAAPAEEVALQVDREVFAPGVYQIESLLPEGITQSVSILPPDVNPEVADYEPLPSLEPQTGYIFSVQQ